jgi:hypothetical protein
MAHHIPAWQVADIGFEPIEDGTDDPVMTLRIRVPGGAILVMAEVALAGRVLWARRLHIHGEGLAANEVGPANLRVVARRLLEELDLDELVVEGAHRTTGAGPGRRPRLLRLSRQPGADPGAPAGSDADRPGRDRTGAARHLPSQGQARDRGDA